MTNSLEGNKSKVWHSSGPLISENVVRKGSFVVVDEEGEHVYYQNSVNVARVSYGSLANSYHHHHMWHEDHHDGCVNNDWRVEDVNRESKVFQVLLVIVLVAIVAVGFLSIMFGVLSVSNIDNAAFYLPTSCSVLQAYGCSCENDDANRFLSRISLVSPLFDSNNFSNNDFSAHEQPEPYPCPTQRKCVFKTLIHSDNSTRTTCLLFPESNYPIGSNTTCYLSENHSSLVSFTFYSSVNEAMKMLAVLFGIFASCLIVVTIFFSIIVAGLKLCPKRKITLMRSNFGINL